MWLPPMGSVAVCWMLPSMKTAMSVQPPPMSATIDALALLFGAQHGLGAGERLQDELIDLHAGRFDHLA